jgi:hypothetical protein
LDAVTMRKAIQMNSRVIEEVAGIHGSTKTWIALGNSLSAKEANS